MIIEIWDLHPEIAKELNKERDIILDKINHPDGKWKFSEELQQKMELIREKSVHKYFELSAGDYDFIMKDARKIIDALERPDCIEARKTRKMFLEDFLEFYGALNEDGSYDEGVKSIRKLIAETKKNYDFAYDFVLRQVEMQTGALEHYGLDTEELNSAAAAKAGQWYKQPETKTRKKPLPAEEKDFYTLPTSPAASLIQSVLANSRLLTSGEGVLAYKDIRQSVAHRNDTEIKKNPKLKDAVYVGRKTDQSETEITIENIGALTSYNKAAKKLFIFALIKINEQILHDGKLTGRYVDFSLQELIDAGFYKSKDTARKGFKEALEAISMIKIKGRLTVKRGQSPKTVEQEGWAYLFPTGLVKNGVCRLYVNDLLNWELLTAFFSVLPRWSFSLPNRSFDLVCTIFNLARQNGRKIAERGYFTISIRTIQEALAIPDPKKTKNPDRDIRQPIEEAITAIEEKQRGTGFYITPIYEDDCSISDFLNNGYLKIELSGDYAAAFIEQSNKQKAKISSAAKRKNRIIEAARIKKMSEQTEKTQQEESQ